MIKKCQWIYNCNFDTYSNALWKSAFHINCIRIYWLLSKTDNFILWNVTLPHKRGSLKSQINGALTGTREKSVYNNLLTIERYLDVKISQMSTEEQWTQGTNPNNMLVSCTMRVYCHLCLFVNTVCDNKVIPLTEPHTWDIYTRIHCTGL